MLRATKQHEDVLTDVKSALGNWRKFLIAIDGRDHAGKSSLARFLSWQIGMPTIETDMLLIPEQGRKYRLNDLRNLIDSRFRLNRPVIVEGIFLLELLAKLKLEFDYLVYVKNQDFEGSCNLQREFAKYEASCKPHERANFIFSRKEN